MIICLNGPSSSGKTAIAKELQELFGGYPLYFSIDNLLYSLPPSALKRMMTGQKNPGLDYSKLEEGFYKSVKGLVFSLIT
jgi:chloramphenicol 3-O phosphotransferase